MEDKKASPAEFIKEGNKVDCKDESSGQWEGGVVKEKNVLTENSVNLIVTMEDTGKEKKYTWPSSDIDFCAARIKERSCDPESVNPDKSATDSVKFSFGKDAVEGYVLDKGEKYGKKGKIEYGWGADSTKNVRRRKGNGNPLLDNQVIFAPARESKWCNGETNHGINCL
jgi:hypothetical protein